ncbi:MAG: PhoH family protein, partial [Sphingomonadales bacterium]|nr:PhoH family protein [Sphingomonadales bacterium]
AHALDILNNVEGVAMVHFTNRDIVRHALVGRIVDAYTKEDDAKSSRKKRHP